MCFWLFEFDLLCCKNTTRMSPTVWGTYFFKTEKFTRNKEGSNVFVWECVCNTNKYLWQSETGANIYVVVRNFYHKLFLIILQLLTKKGYACQTIEYMHHYTPSYGWFYLRDWYWFLSYFLLTSSIFIEVSQSEKMWNGIGLCWP